MSSSAKNAFSCAKMSQSFTSSASVSVTPLPIFSWLSVHFRKMHNALRTDSIFGNYKASGYLYDFLMEFYRLIAYKDPATAVSSALMKALDYINYNYFSPITMDELCSVSGVTKQHLCLLFRKKLSMRPMEYIAKRRIQEAKALLTGTEKSIEQVAEETGFCSESYFCKLFKRYEGMTPSAFRQIK